MNNNILKEIKKANKLTELVFDYLYKLNDKKFNKSIYRLGEINELLTNLEIELEMKLEDKKDEWLQQTIK